MITGTAKQALGNAPYCGDAFGDWCMNGTRTLCIVDGLGHGEHAETAARAALDCVIRHLSHPLADVFAICDRALRDTRGVVMGIAVIDEATGKLTYAGVGNTSILIAGTGQHRLGSDPGIVGAGYRSLSLESVPLRPNDLVIMWTDGIEPALELEVLPSWRTMSPRRLAEVILQSWRRESDDAAVLVFRYNSQDDG